MNLNTWLYQYIKYTCVSIGTDCAKAYWGWDALLYVPPDSGDVNLLNVYMEPDDHWVDLILWNFTYEDCSFGGGWNCDHPVGTTAMLGNGIYEVYGTLRLISKIDGSGPLSWGSIENNMFDQQCIPLVTGYCGGGLYFTVTAQQTPEPGTLLMLGSGLLTAGYGVRRRVMKS